jgi:putative component of membrane protein insertase Oxa1/YidC/SpoIIIJ protein YidD
MPANATSISWTVPVQGTIDSVTNGGLSAWVTYIPTGSNYSGTVSATARNNCSVSAARTLSVTIQACTPSGIVGTDPVKQSVEMPPAPEQETDFSTLIYPNPTTYKFFVQVKSSYSEPVTVRVLDQQGREMGRYQKILPGSVLQIGEQLRPGIYLVEIRQGKKTEIKKVIKQ